MNETKKRADSIDAEVISRIIHDLLSSLVKYPQFLTVQSEIVDDRFSLIASAHPRDMGQLIGTRSRNCDSMATLMVAMAKPLGFKAHYKVEDMDQHTAQRVLNVTQGHLPPTECPSDIAEQAEAKIRLVCDAAFALPYEVMRVSSERRNKLKFAVDIDRDERKYVTDAEFEDALSRTLNVFGHRHGADVYVQLRRGE